MTFPILHVATKLYHRNTMLYIFERNFKKLKLNSSQKKQNLHQRDYELLRDTSFFHCINACRCLEILAFFIGIVPEEAR